jgi:hypothetical protein
MKPFWMPFSLLHVLLRLCFVASAVLLRQRWEMGYDWNGFDNPKEDGSVSRTKGLGSRDYGSWVWVWNLG